MARKKPETVNRLPTYKYKPEDQPILSLRTLSKIAFLGLLSYNTHLTIERDPEEWFWFLTNWG